MRVTWLIEYLHLIQDKFGCLSATHLRSLAELLRVGQAEVYEGRDLLRPL